jgi:hypothetical protein
MDFTGGYKSKGKKKTKKHIQPIDDFTQDNFNQFYDKDVNSDLGEPTHFGENEVEEKLNVVDLQTRNTRMKILSDKKNWADLKCIFCLQNVRFYDPTNRTPSNYILLSEDDITKIEEKVAKHIKAGTFQTKGACMIAYDLNTEVLPVYNNIITKNYTTKYPEVTAEDVYEHFCRIPYIKMVW